MSSEVVLGIDLGTTNSVVAVADSVQARVLRDVDGSQLIPSVVSFQEGGRVLVGEVARERRLSDAANTVYAVKRLIGRPFHSPEVRAAIDRCAFELVPGRTGGVDVRAQGEQWTLPEISAYVLRECRRRAEQVLGRSCDKAVITVPANFNELQRSATKAAGAIAGLDVLRILNEPTAAAVAYGYGGSDVRRVAIYDLGGGTFDITILELHDEVFEVVATAGDTFLGGDDFDRIIAERMASWCVETRNFDPTTDPQAFERLRAAAEWAKCMLSSQAQVRVRVPELTKGRDGKPIDFEAEVSRAEVDALLTPLVEESATVCRNALDLAGFTADDIDRVVLVGGSTRVPLVRKIVGEFFGRDPQLDFDPDLVVALGAAIQGYSLATSAAPKAVFVPPSPDALQEKRRAIEAARAERPDQPAFPPAVLGGLELKKVPVPATLRKPAIPDIREETVHRSADGRRDSLADASNAGNSTGSPQERRRQRRKRLSQELAKVDAPAKTVGKPPSLPVLELDAPLTTIPLTGETPMLEDLPVPGSMPPPLPITGLVPALPSVPQAGRPPPIPSDLAPDPASEDIEITFPYGEPDELDFPEDGPQMAVKLPESRPLILMDVTPHSLGIESVGSYCERIIRRNSPIPVEQTRIFTTGNDWQESVLVTVCQGESREFADNETLGSLELIGLRKARRGEVKIEVTFMLDANGTLDVRARDTGTGAAQTISINLIGGFDPEELAALRARQDDTWSL